MQGVVKAFDPGTRLGSVVSDVDRAEIDLAAEALARSTFRFLRQGQRVNFDLDADGRATNLRFGSERDMLTPSEEPGT